MLKSIKSRRYFKPDVIRASYVGAEAAPTQVALAKAAPLAEAAPTCGTDLPAFALKIKTCKLNCV
jgi:hypothetical protein